MKPPHKGGPRGHVPGRPQRHGSGPQAGGPRPHTPRAHTPRPEKPRPEKPRPDTARPDTGRPETPRHAAPRGERLSLPPRPAEPQGEPRRLGQPALGEQFRRQEHPKFPRPDAARGADTPRGTIWLYGLHAVAAALANPNRRLRRLLLTTEAEAALAGKQPPPWAVTAETVDRGRLDKLLGRDTIHQGVALLADPLAPPALAQALERPGPVLVLDQVNDPRNVGAILRAAAAFGAAAVITQERNAPEETGALAKAASGALEKLPLFRAVNIARTLVALKAAGLWVVGLDAGGTTLSGPALRARRIALVLGNEGEGLRRLTRDTCDEICGLAVPKGHASEMESLNVSAAAAIALYELNRQ